MEFLQHYSLYLAQTITWMVAVITVVATSVALLRKSKDNHPTALKVKRLNQRYDELRDAIENITLTKKTLRALSKQRKKTAKELPEHSKKIFVIEFTGDIKASAVSSLRECVTAVLQVATKHDEIVINLESAGGMVNAYGLAASQLARIKHRNIPLTVCIDKIAASGGYLMACVANKIVAAPFAIIGSIGVVAQLPNFHRLLKKNDIDFEQITSGEYKRTLSLFGENTDKARTKVQHEIEEIHELFKQFIKQHRSHLNLDEVATGEHWLATQAQQLGLLDKIACSDDYLLEASQQASVYEVCYQQKPTMIQKLLGQAKTLGQELVALVR